MIACMRQFWGSSSKPFKVLMALALLVMTTMQVGAYAQNGTAFFKSPSVAERQLESHLHHANHASANTDTVVASASDIPLDKHSGKHASVDADCAVHCAPLTALISVHVQIMAIPSHHFESVAQRVLISNVQDSQARPPKHMI
jgi:hypothetical protein